MPYKASEARRHKIPRARYKVTNWPEYDRALQQRGNLAVWVTPEALEAWHPPHTGQRGRPRDYSDVAIETGHLLRLAFGRPWRQTEGLLRSITALLGIDVGVPDHTTFSRRSPGLALATALAHTQRRGPVHVVIDATGLKVCIRPVKAADQLDSFRLVGGFRVHALASAATSSASASTSTAVRSKSSPIQSFISAWFSCAGSARASRNSS